MVMHLSRWFTAMMLASNPSRRDPIGPRLGRAFRRRCSEEPGPVAGPQCTAQPSPGRFPIPQHPARCPVKEAIHPLGQQRSVAEDGEVLHSSRRVPSRHAAISIAFSRPGFKAHLGGLGHQKE
jgi:hypothetical protein